MRADHYATVPEDLFWDALMGAIAGMPKRDPTAYEFEMDGQRFRFTDTAMGRFSFALLAWLEKAGQIDVYMPIILRHDLMMRVVGSGKLGPHLTYREGSDIAVHRAVYNVSSRFPVKRASFNRKDFVAACEAEFAVLDPPCSRCKLAVAEHENGLCDECFLKEQLQTA